MRKPIAPQVSRAARAAAASSAGSAPIDHRRFPGPSQSSTLGILPAPLFNLGLTIESGQVFHWQPRGGGWVGLIGATPVRVAVDGDQLRVTSGCEALVAHYFALDHPLEEIYGSFPSDDYTRTALRFCQGLRIIRQPRWECIATFITSSMKQFRHIQQMSLAIRARFGTPVAGSAICAYPPPAVLGAATETELRACGLGFRAENLLKTARMIAGGDVDLESIAAMDNPGAVRELCRLPGVGDKVANCILLFAYERLDAVPIDVWIGRVLRAMIGADRTSASTLRNFSQQCLGMYAGYVQQYLFHYARVSKSLPAK